VFSKNIATFRQDPMLLFTLLIVGFLLVVFILFPLFKVLTLSVTGSGTFSLSEFRYIFEQWWLRQTFFNSMLLGVITATTSTIIGYIFAYAFARTSMRGRWFFRPLAMLPLVSPPFMFTLSVILLLGRNGLITRYLLGLRGFNIYGLKGLVLVQTIGMFPIAFMNLEGVLQSIGTDLEEAALDLGASRLAVFRNIVLPLSIPGITSSWLLIFVTSLADFANPLVLGGRFDVLSVQAYLQFTGMFNAPRGAALAVLLLFPSLIAFTLQRYLISRRSYVTVTGKPGHMRLRFVSRWLEWCLFAICLMVTGIILLFYLTVIAGAFVKKWGIDWSLSLEHWHYTWDVAFRSFAQTLQLAGIATPISALLGMLIAFLLVRKSFVGKSALGFTSMLSYAVPGTVVGIGYILAFNQPPLLLTGTGLILIICFVFRFMPVSVETGVSQLVQIDRSIEEASTNLGASTAYTFRSITMPLIKPAFIAGLSFAFTRCMTAISAIIFLVSGRWHHVTVLILSQTEIMNLGAASVISLVLVIVVLTGFGLIRLAVGDKNRRLSV
jgi:iron(III) transport system permease protein